MASKPYIQQAWSVLQTGATTLRNDMHALRQKAESEKSHWLSVSVDAQKKRADAEQRLPREESEVERDSLRKNIAEANKEIEESRQKIHEIERQVLQREQSSGGIARVLDDYASQLNNLLARSDFE